MRSVSYIHALDGKNRLRVNFEIEFGRVLSFVAQLECYFEDNGWLPIVRYDTAHGFVHRDRMHPRKETEKTATPVRSNEDGLTYGVDDLKANWQTYRRRYEEWLEN